MLSRSSGSCERGLAVPTAEVAGLVRSLVGRTLSGREHVSDQRLDLEQGAWLDDVVQDLRPTGAVTSASAFSVSISAMTSPASTSAPDGLSH